MVMQLEPQTEAEIIYPESDGEAITSEVTSPKAIAYQVRPNYGPEKTASWMSLRLKEYLKERLIS